jgi:hypothetical protein
MLERQSAKRAGTPRRVPGECFMLVGSTLERYIGSSFTVSS